MEHPSFEVSGGTQKTPEIKEELNEFNWHEFEPPWIEKIREAAKTDEKYAADLKTKEIQMESIAELAREAGIEFRGKITHSSSELLAEEGVIGSDSLEFHKKQERIWGSPLLLMISWGRENGVITSEEARELREWYKPEL